MSCIALVIIVGTIRNLLMDLWDEYCRLRKEMKELVREKKLNINFGERLSRKQIMVIGKSSGLL